VKCASIAASLAGCSRATMRALEWPETSAARLKIVAKRRAPLNERRANSWCRPLSRYQAEMERMKNEPMIIAPMSVWTRRFTVDGLKTTAQKSTTSARVILAPSTVQGTPSRTIWTTWWPAGVCCQLLATTIQTAENIDPRATMIVARRWKPALTRSQPKTRTARKPDSRKKAKMPSAASAEPKTSPTKRE